MKQRMRGLGMLSPREELVNYDKIQGFISETLAVIENDIWVLIACQLSTTDLIFEIIDHFQRMVSSAILLSASVSKRMLLQTGHWHHIAVFVPFLPCGLTR